MLNVIFRIIADEGRIKVPKLVYFCRKDNGKVANRYYRGISKILVEIDNRTQNSWFKLFGKKVGIFDFKARKISNGELLGLTLVVNNYTPAKL